MGCCCSREIDESTVPLLHDNETTSPMTTNNISLVQETAEQMLDINLLHDKLLPSQIKLREQGYRDRLEGLMVDDVFEEIEKLEFEEDLEVKESREFEPFTVDFE